VNSTARKLCGVSFKYTTFSKSSYYLLASSRAPRQVDGAWCRIPGVSVASAVLFLNAGARPRHQAHFKGLKIPKSKTRSLAVGAPR
jgi:hypothetical protein